jgi:hypothetical protein
VFQFRAGSRVALSLPGGRYRAVNYPMDHVLPRGRDARFTDDAIQCIDGTVAPQVFEYEHIVDVVTEDVANALDALYRIEIQIFRYHGGSVSALARAQKRHSEQFDERAI